MSPDICPELPGEPIQIPNDQHVHLIGPSGIGKTVHLKRHACSLSRQSEIVILCSGRHYVDSLERLIARSIAQYTRETPTRLISAASKCSRRIHLIVDGIDSLSIERQRDIIEATAAFALRFGARVVISSMEPMTIPAAIVAALINLLALDDNQKRAVFAFHAPAGINPPSKFLDALETAHDVMVAAKAVSIAASSGASRADFYGAYLFQSLPSDSRTVAGALLRRLAYRFHQDFLQSVEFHKFERDSIDFLREAGGALSVVDAVSKMPQVTATRGFFSFRHDLWQNYLAAEYLISSSSDKDSLCRALRMPINRRLVAFVVGRLRDPDAVALAIESGCESLSVSDALAGGLGRLGAEYFERKCRKIWDALTVKPETLRLQGDYKEDTTRGPRRFYGVLQIETQIDLSACDRNVAQWASGRIHEQGFAEQFVEAIERSATALWQASAATADDAHAPAARIFGDAVHQLLNLRGPGIPLTVFSMFHDWDNGHWTRVSRTGGHNLLLLDLFEDRLSASKESTIAVILLCLSVILRHEENPTPDLIERVFFLGWKQNFHPVRSSLLQLIEMHGRYLLREVPETADYIKATLEGALGSNPIANTFIFDALNALDAVPPPISREECELELQRIIGANLAEPDSSQLGDLQTLIPPADLADSFVSKFWEDIFQGIYWDVYQGLGRQDKVKLMNCAAMRDGSETCDRFVLKELVSFSDTTSREAFQFHAREVRLESMMFQDAVANWCLGIIGCARLKVELPAWRGGSDVASTAWRLIGQLLFIEHAGGANEQMRGAWRAIDRQTALGVADVFYHLQLSESSISMFPDLKELGCWTRLIRHTEDVRDLVEYSLQNLDQLVSMYRWDRANERARFIVSTLGEIGCPSSAVLLRPFLTHPTLGGLAVTAIERLSGMERSDRLAQET